ncbi:hypothetical protein [Gimesia sp.]|uniref:hypothetical protein n=1 Tax=Gimesia sp. TaxID=2024833 RepID=UPI003A95D5C0
MGKQDVTAPAILPDSSVLYFPSRPDEPDRGTRERLLCIVFIPVISVVRVPPLGLTDGADAT